MSTAVARRPAETKIGRPLKILIPLIKQDIERGDQAGMQYYADAGDKLLEARPQVPYGSWGRWLQKNFTLGRTTAHNYIRAAEVRRDHQNFRRPEQLPTFGEITGDTQRKRQSRVSERPFRASLQGLNTDLFTQVKQTRDEEVRLHREMALELVDIGYKALATRLHPDRGGSKDAMSRLNRVRDELKGIAETRRFV